MRESIEALLTLWLIAAMLALLGSCAPVADKSQRFVGVPLLDWPKADQQAAAAAIEATCGSPPTCPRDAVLERATLLLVKQRDAIRAANK